MYPCSVPEKVQEPEFVPKMPSQCEEEAEAAADEEEEEEEEDDDDDAVMVPQVRVAEDGTLIIDEERLVDFYRTYHYLSTAFSQLL